MKTKAIVTRITELLVALIFILLCWHLLALALHSNILPTPYQALRTFVEVFAGQLWPHFCVSAYRVFASLALALLAAVPFGLLLGRVEKLDRLFAPVVYIVYPIPKIVLLPIVFLILGLGDQSKIFMIWLIVFFQILVTARDAAKGVPRQNIYSMRSLGAGRWQIFRHVIFPASLPKIITSLRISLGTAIAVLFFVESFATTEGLGYFIMDAWSRMDYAEMFAGIIGMSLLGLILYAIVDLAEAIFCRWQHF